MRLNDSTEGRWLSPDPLGGDIPNPQSLNRYAYALNNPTTLTDPSGLDANGSTNCVPNSSGGVTCSGPTTATVTALALPPVINPCAMTPPASYGGPPSCVPVFYFGGTLSVTSSGAPSGGGTPEPAPKPTPPGLQVSTIKLIRSFNQCAANFADKYSIASLLHANKSAVANALLGSTSAAASHMLFGAHPREYVPAGASLAAGVKAGVALRAGATQAGAIPIDQGFQSIFTTIAPTTLGQTAAGKFLTGAAAQTGELLDAILPFQVAYDEALYGAGEAGCTAGALGW
ncbi:MAG: RHS repeat-associated core domain-containing protein [Terriglobia bacterium]